MVFCNGNDLKNALISRRKVDNSFSFICFYKTKALTRSRISYLTFQFTHFVAKKSGITNVQVETNVKKYNSRFVPIN